MLFFNFFKIIFVNKKMRPNRAPPSKKGCVRLNLILTKTRTKIQLNILYYISKFLQIKKPQPKGRGRLKFKKLYFLFFAVSAAVTSLLHRPGRHLLPTGQIEDG